MHADDFGDAEHLSLAHLAEPLTTPPPPAPTIDGHQLDITATPRTPDSAPNHQQHLTVSLSPQPPPSPRIVSNGNSFRSQRSLSPIPASPPSSRTSAESAADSANTSSRQVQPELSAAHSTLNHHGEEEDDADFEGPSLTPDASPGRRPSTPGCPATPMTPSTPATDGVDKRWVATMTRIAASKVHASRNFNQAYRTHYKQHKIEGAPLAGCGTCAELEARRVTLLVEQESVDDTLRDVEERLVVGIDETRARLAKTGVSDHGKRVSKLIKSNKSGKALPPESKSKLCMSTHGSGSGTGSGSGSSGSDSEREHRGGVMSVTEAGDTTVVDDEDAGEGTSLLIGQKK